jgi:hypothetical protein
MWLQGARAVATQTRRAHNPVRMLPQRLAHTNKDMTGKCDDLHGESERFST